MISGVENIETIIATKDAVSCDLNGEAVILHLPSESYFGLDPVGASIWEFIQEGRTFHEICDHLLAEYDVTREQCESEVQRLIESMREEGLVEVIQHAT